MIYTFSREDAFASNTHVITDGTHALVIDPSTSLDEIIKREPSLKEVLFERCLLTHAHIDHFLEIESYHDRGIPITLPEKEVRGLDDIFYNCAFMLRSTTLRYEGVYTTVSGGDKICTSLGEIEVISTPGHTEGSVCYLYSGNLFSGDTVFEGGGYGRYDLPTGSLTDLLHSLRELKALDPEIYVYSGHGGSFKLGDSLKYLNI